MSRPNRVRDAAMLALANQGLSARLIAARLGITRNAVIGALWRERRRQSQPAPAAPPPPPRRKPGLIQLGWR